MNDVKINSVDFAARQGATTSSSPPNPAKTEQGESKASDQLREKELRELKEQEAATTVEANKQQVADAVTKLNDYVQSVQRDLQFNLDDDSGKTIITVVDSRTSEVVRQIPDDVALRLAQDLQQDEPLSLFNAKV